MSNKIFIRLSDTSGTFFIPTQSISVNRTQIKEVVNDEFVANAILNKGVVELTAKEVEAYKATLEASNPVVVSMPNAHSGAVDDVEKAEKEAALKAEKEAALKLEAAKNVEEVYLKGVETGKIAVLKDDTIKIGKITFENKEQAIAKLLEDEKLLKALKAEIEKA